MVGYRANRDSSSTLEYETLSLFLCAEISQKKFSFSVSFYYFVIFDCLTEFLPRRVTKIIERRDKGRQRFNM